MAGYICKIVIEDTHPPVWRRVVIPDKITFAQLHDIIQILFDWGDHQLHEFQTSSDFIRIGNERSWQRKYYEEKESLIDSFFRNYKWIRYTYDFGAQWRHKIIIESADLEYYLRKVTLLKYKGDNLVEDDNEIGEMEKASRKVFCQEKVTEKLNNMELQRHEELEEVPLLKETMKEFRELFNQLMQMKPEVLQSEMAKVIEELEDTHSKMTLKIDAWKKYERKSGKKMVQIAICEKTQKDLLMDLGEKEATDYYKYLRIPRQGLLQHQEQVEAVTRVLQEHPEYLLYVFDADEYQDLQQLIQCDSKSVPVDNINGDVVIKSLAMGLADFINTKEVGILHFASDANSIVRNITVKDRKKVYKLLSGWDERVGKLLQVYGVMEMEILYEIYKQLYTSNIEYEDFLRIIYWHARYNDFVSTVYKLDGTGYIALKTLDIQHIIKKTEKYAKDLSYAKFSAKEISDMGENLSNRSDWVDVLMSSFHYQLRMEFSEAEETLYWVISAILSGDNINQIMEALKKQNSEYWEVEIAADLWTILVGLMLELELPMLKGRSRMQYAKEQKISPWSLEIADEDVNLLTTKECPMYCFPVQVQEWMNQAADFGENDCITKLLAYKDEKQICSEEYLYLLTNSCIIFGHTSQAKALIGQLKTSSVTGKKLAKRLENRLQERHEVMDDDWFDTMNWEPMMEETAQQPYIRSSVKTGRNDPCPCGSGKKYKKCCGK